MTRQKNVTGFVADFHYHVSVKKVLNRNNIKPPEEWDGDPASFKVIKDGGRVLTLDFWDWNKDIQVGDIIFEVGYEDVECWA